MWLPRKVTLQFGITDIHEAIKYIMFPARLYSVFIAVGEPFWFNEFQTEALAPTYEDKHQMLAAGYITRSANRLSGVQLQRLC